MAKGYFGEGYFKEDYWNDNFWAPAASQQGNFWSTFYWNDDYWNENFWRRLYTGDVFQGTIPQLQLTEYVVQVKTGPVVQADTEVLTLTTFQVAVENAIAPPISAPALILTPFAAEIETTGYQAGDIDLNIFPDSTFTITYGVVPPPGSLNLLGHGHTLGYEGGYNVSTSIAQLAGFDSFPVNAANEVDVEPLPQALTLTEYSTFAGVGWLIELSGASRTFATPTHTIEGFSDVKAKPLVQELTLTAWNPAIYGRPPLFIPPGTWPPDTSIVNPNADYYPSNYEISDRSGFRVRRGGLVREWTGAMVRPEEFERRNAQDFVRGVGDEQTGSPRPEQDDRFVYDEYPGGVRADDL